MWLIGCFLKGLSWSWWRRRKALVKLQEESYEVYCKSPGVLTCFVSWVNSYPYVHYKHNCVFQLTSGIDFTPTNGGAYKSVTRFSRCRRMFRRERKSLSTFYQTVGTLRTFSGLYITWGLFIALEPSFCSAFSCVELKWFCFIGRPVLRFVKFLSSRVKRVTARRLWNNDNSSCSQLTHIV
jgi:hypothetical protein